MRSGLVTPGAATGDDSVATVRVGIAAIDTEDHGATPNSYRDAAFMAGKPALLGADPSTRQH
jgi:hypothetical protein